MSRQRRFTQLDVFTDRALLGNALAVVHDAEGLGDEQMAAFARWTNLSETTFLLAPTEPGADYRVRIFTPTVELPFAGHPTLGSCHAWLAAGGEARRGRGLAGRCATRAGAGRGGEGEGERGGRCAHRGDARCASERRDAEARRNLTRQGLSG